MFKRVQHDKYQKFKAKMDRVWTMDGLEFEEFTCDILKENGFKDVKKTQACGDYGVDRKRLLQSRYSSSVDNIFIYKKCKKYSCKIKCPIMGKNRTSKTNEKCAQ